MVEYVLSSSSNPWYTPFNVSHCSLTTLIYLNSCVGILMDCFVPKQPSPPFLPDNASSYSRSIPSSPMLTTSTSPSLQQSPNSGEGRVNPRYKTQLCRHFEKHGYCDRDDTCWFAHGDEELRPLPRQFRNRPIICKNYQRWGVCPYGKQCLFKHE